MNYLQCVKDALKLAQQLSDERRNVCNHLQEISKDLESVGIKSKVSDEGTRLVLQSEFGLPILIAHLHIANVFPLNIEVINLNIEAESQANEYCHHPNNLVNAFTSSLRSSVFASRLISLMPKQ